MTLIVAPLSRSRRTLAFALLVTAIYAHVALAQQTETPAKGSTPAPAEKNAAQIELLETKYRFEINGDSRKEVYAQVRINNELGVRQFARLNFDFNRSFQSVEIPLVRITHPSGGIADILPSAITDNPNPAVVDFPAYHDVRVKSVRILGLEPGDLLEYRVITTTTHHPLAPDFWLDHTFDRTGVVTHEIFKVEFPVAVKANLDINPDTPSNPCPSEGHEDRSTKCFLWDHKGAARPEPGEPSEAAEDISLATFESWNDLAEKMEALIFPTKGETVTLVGRTPAIASHVQEALLDDQSYEFVSQKIKTVDLPIDATGFQRRKALDILDSGYGTAEDKFVLFAALRLPADAAFVLDSGRKARDVPSPTRFKYLLTLGHDSRGSEWLDLNAEVAPEGMVPAQFHGKPALVVSPNVSENWQKVTPKTLYESSQQVHVNASLAPVGALSAKVRYRMRGENELTLRVAFHKTEKENWKNVAQMLAISDGFRGQITKVTASDPYATHEPFQVEYEISQPKFVDWSKKPVRIPALLPLPGLPDAEPPASSAKKSIDLGTPLDIQLDATVQLPEGTTVQVPIGTSVERDYATFSSKYSAEGNIIQATRKLHFILREIPAARAADWNAFLHAVQADQAQLFTLQPPAKN